MSFESKATKEAKAKIKKENKGDKDMKNNSTVKTIVTVTLTLIAVAALVGSFLGGIQYQKGINSDVQAQVKDMAAVVSKDQQ